MKKALALSFCVALGGCADYGFDPMAAVSPRANEVQPLDSASTTQLYLSVVNGLLRQERYRAALAYLDQYAVKEKKTPYFRELYGEALLGTGQYDAAASSFAALEGTNLAPEGFNGLGRVAAAQGDWPAAAGYFQQAVDARPSSAEFLNNLGYAQLCAGGDMLAAAEFNLRQAQELDPGSESIRTNLLIALMMAGKNDEARRLLSAIPASHQRAEVQNFAAAWVKERQPAAVTTEEDM